MNTMISTHSKVFFWIYTFLVVFQTSTQYSITFDTSEENSNTSSSSSSSEELLHEKLIKGVRKLDPDQRREMHQQLINHMMFIRHIQGDERKIEHKMLEDLTKISYFETGTIAVLKKLRKINKEGRETLDKIMEKRKSEMKPQTLEIIQYYADMWIQIDSKKYNEAKDALENIDAILSHIVKSATRRQLKTLQDIQQIIRERTKKVDQESREVIDRLDALHGGKKSPTTPPPDTLNLNPALLFDENDVNDIREVYNFLMEKISKMGSAENKTYQIMNEKSGMPFPLLFKSVAEMNVIKRKIITCDNKGDRLSRDVLLQTLNQPHYKKMEEIVGIPTPPPNASLETIVEVIRNNFYN